LEFFSEAYTALLRSMLEPFGFRNAEHHLAAVGRTASCSPGAMVGHMSPAMVRYYTHISAQAARQAVEMLEKVRGSAQFVDVFVDASLGQQEKAAKSMERETGIEPVTSSLGSWRSTAELLPLNTVASEW
jgi:hypothetical protein